MSITNPEHRFRLRLLLWAGNYRGEQPFTSAPQRSLLDVLTLVKEIKRNKAIDSQVRSYVIQEELDESVWTTLDYSDWCDL